MIFLGTGLSHTIMKLCLTFVSFLLSSIFLFDISSSNAFYLAGHEAEMVAGKEEKIFPDTELVRHIRSDGTKNESWYRNLMKIVKELFLYMFRNYVMKNLESKFYNAVSPPSLPDSIPI